MVKRSKMQDRQGVASTPTGAYYPYATKRRGATTQHIAVYSSFYAWYLISPSTMVYFTTPDNSIPPKGLFFPLLTNF